MARLVCFCGQELSNSTRPEIEYKVFSDDEWLRLMSSKINDPVVDIEWPELYIWKCFGCGRLHMFKGNDDKQVAIYIPEKISPATEN